MQYYTQKCLQQFTKNRASIIIQAASMTRQTIEASISDAWLLDHLKSDSDFKKQLNNQLQKNFLSDIKCGATCNFMSRIGDDEAQLPIGYHSSPLDVLIGLEVGLAGLGQVVDVDTRALANDLGITRRQALREKNRQAAIAKVQVGLFEGVGNE